MILLCGIPSEPPIAMVREQLDRLNVPYIIFNQRDFTNIGLEFEVSVGRVRGSLQLGNRNYPLEHVRGIYTRLMDPRYLPELRNEPADSPIRRYCLTLHDTLMHWYNIAPIRVLSRIGPMGSNFSKPYQAQIIRECGFLVPESLITNDPDLVHEFRKRHQKVIYKSISSIRSIVQTLEDKDIERLDSIRWCPTLFQEFIEGDNVRVHVVGNKVFATAIRTDRVDYRYAHEQGGHTELQAIELSDELNERCVYLSQTLGLEFTGIDLKVTQDNQVFCFEVNPGPAFSYYEYYSGQPIAKAVADYLIECS